MEPKVKECPFCGEDTEVEGYDGNYEIECLNCSVRMRDFGKEDLIKRWNKRVIILR